MPHGPPSDVTENPDFLAFIKAAQGIKDDQTLQSIITSRSFSKQVGKLWSEFQAKGAPRAAKRTTANESSDSEAPPKKEPVKKKPKQEEKGQKVKEPSEDLSSDSSSVKPPPKAQKKPLKAAVRKPADDSDSSDSSEPAPVPPKAKKAVKKAGSLGSVSSASEPPPKKPKKTTAPPPKKADDDELSSDLSSGSGPVPEKAAPVQEKRGGEDDSASVDTELLDEVILKSNPGLDSEGLQSFKNSRSYNKRKDWYLAEARKRKASKTGQTAAPETKKAKGERKEMLAKEEEAEGEKQPPASAAEPPAVLKPTYDTSPKPKAHTPYGTTLRETSEILMLNQTPASWYSPNSISETRASAVKKYLSRLSTDAAERSVLEKQLGSNNTVSLREKICSTLHPSLDEGLKAVDPVCVGDVFTGCCLLRYKSPEIAKAAWERLRSKYQADRTDATPSQVLSACVVDEGTLRLLSFTLVLAAPPVAQADGKYNEVKLFHPPDEPRPPPPAPRTAPVEGGEAKGWKEWTEPASSWKEKKWQGADEAPAKPAAPAKVPETFNEYLCQKLGLAEESLESYKMSRAYTKKQDELEAEYEKLKSG